MTSVNYAQFAVLLEKYSQKGFHILAFPSNQFGKQEPKSNEEIRDFVFSEKKVPLDLFSKINMNGNNVPPLFKYLKSHKNGSGFLTNSIKWNFTKFLVDRKGQLFKRYGPNTNPLDIAQDIERLLDL